MADLILANAPLVEAIFEYRWKVPESNEKTAIQPDYRLMVGRLFETLREKYPVHEPLDTVNIPEKLIPNIVQHRFRKSDGGWPLVQIGPGIVTLNETEGYSWPKFREGTSELLDAFQSVYSSSGAKPATSGLLLRYIDAIEFDYSQHDILRFLADELKTVVTLKESLFECAKLISRPSSADIRLAFPSTDPKGELHIRFARGQNHGKDSLIWETQFILIEENMVSEVDEMIAWLDKAHEVTHKWFFEAIKPNLINRFL